ncbi:MAG: c-type cytochrome biogenesis protein CcsB [Microbacteriaceae bacterium]
MTIAALVDTSNMLLYSAMAVYLLAFISFALDLSRRSEAPAAGAAPYSPGASLRAGIALAVIGFLLHTGATLARGLANGHVPWSNMFEFSLTATNIVVAVFLVLLFRADLRFLGTFVIGFVLLMLGLATVGFYVDIVPLAPALQSGWLVFHVFVASLGVGFFTVGAALAALQLLKTRQKNKGAEGRLTRMLDTVPAVDRLEALSYRVNLVGYIFWTFTLVAGAIWAERAWGRYWGWDTKEVWTFIIWVLYSGYIHSRATRGWRGSRSAWLAIIGFAAVLFNFTIVNIFFKGLHAYSGL